MTDDSMLDGFDPFDALDREAVRLDAYFSTLPPAEWSMPSRCPGWTTRDMLAHLAAAEEYHRAGLEGRVAEYLVDLGEKGAIDLDSANQVGIDQLADYTPDELLSMWRAANLENRLGFRERGDAEIDTSVGPYPNRWQAFHVASELATHADDIGVPVADDEAGPRRAWRRAFSLFALAEAKPDVKVAETSDGRILVSGDGVTVEVDDDELIEGVMGRLEDAARLTPEQRTLLRA